MTFVSAAITTNLRTHNPPVEAIVYDTFNPDDAGLYVEFLNDNLTATNLTANGGGMTRSVIGKSSGKYYFEIDWVNAAAGTGTVGCGLATLTETQVGGANSWSVWGRNWGARHNSSNALSFATDGSERWGFAVDLDGGKLWIWDGNADAWLQGDPETDTSPIWSNLSGTLYPAAQPWTPGVGVEITLHSDPANFNRATPSGYTAGWPTT